MRCLIDLEPFLTTSADLVELIEVTQSSLAL